MTKVRNFLCSIVGWHKCKTEEVIHKQYIADLIYLHWNVKSLTGDEFAYALAALVGDEHL